MKMDNLDSFQNVFDYEGKLISLKKITQSNYRSDVVSFPVV